MSSLRVLHVGKFYPPYRGGMEVFLADLLTTQRAQGMDAAALVHGTPEADDPPWLVRVPVQFSVLYAPIAFGFRGALARAIHQFKPDVLHLHMPNNSALWVLTLPQARAIPWVVHWHSDVVLSNIKWSVAAAYALYRPFEHAVLDGAERIIATSQPYLEASVPLRHWRSKCAVVPLGLNTSALPTPQTSEATPFWQPQTELRLLSIGRLTYYKGFETLIAAVQGLSGVELLIAGDGELRAPLQALIHATTRTGMPPSVRLLGEVTEADKHALLASCDVFCLASRERTEAFGVVLLEAMYHARPCIVTDLPGSGMPWVVSQAHAGLRVPIEDIPGWQSAITRLQLDDRLRKQLGDAGKRALSQHFGIAPCARMVERQYRFIAPTVSAPARATEGTLVILSTHNHAATISALVRNIHNHGHHHILVVDNRSIDGTCHLAESAGAVVLRPLIAMAPWGAIQTGLRYAQAKGYASAVTLDGSGKYTAQAIQILLDHACKADLLIGASTERASARRQLASQWFRRLAGFDVRDITSGLRYYNRLAIDTLAARGATLLDYPDLGVLLLAQRAGLRIGEAPVTINMPMPERSNGIDEWLSIAKYLTASTLLCVARWNVGRSRQ